MSKPILPGATIGIFGSGQLGRMLTLAAKTMGYRVHTYSPEADTPTGQVADLECTARYDDIAAVEAFVRNTDVVTFEFENIDAAIADVAATTGVPVHPGDWVLRTAQNRVREKGALRDAGLPVTPFLPVETEVDLRRAGSQLGFPLVLKTASSGYDGKGQAVVADADELHAAWQRMERRMSVAERYIAFDKEISVVSARDEAGNFVHYGAIENVHRNHILDLSLSPARIPQETAHRAVRLAQSTMDTLDVVGTMCVEFFLSVEGELLINEIAPRPHNSGHLTIEASCTSQFEQHIRAICGLPLGRSDLPRPAAMANLLGDLWIDGMPDWRTVLAYPTVKLHLYGKRVARQGRKMGHLTAVASDVDTAADAVLSARRALTESTSAVDTAGGETSATIFTAGHL